MDQDQKGAGGHLSAVQSHTRLMCRLWNVWCSHHMICTIAITQQPWKHGDKSHACAEHVQNWPGIVAQSVPEAVVLPLRSIRQY